MFFVIYATKIGIFSHSDNKIYIFLKQIFLFVGKSVVCLTILILITGI